MTKILIVYGQIYLVRESLRFGTDFAFIDKIVVFSLFMSLL